MMHIKSDIKDIKAVLTDVDGVLTDGTFSLDENGSERKTFNVRDGQLLRFCREQLQLKFGALSGRGGKPTALRLEQMAFDFVALEVQDKQRAYEEFKKRFKLEDADILYIGDDLIDLPVLQNAGIAVCPQDASSMVLPYCDIQTNAPGGRGVLREVLEEIIHEKSVEQDLLGMYLPKP